MKIYFSGSIRGGRNDAALYAKIISLLKSKGAEVLTEHIGNASLDDEGDDVTIYTRDVALLRACDMVIAECTTPSLGVGYELAYAESIGKPVHIFYNEGRSHLSAMLAGDAYFAVRPYSSEDELLNAVDGLF